MRLRFIVVSESISLDSRSNSLSIFHITEEINSPSFPAFVQKLSVVALLERQLDEPNVPEALALEIKIDQDHLYSGPVQVDFQGRIRMRAIIELQGFLVPRPGTVTFIMRSEGISLGEWQIDATRIGEQVAQIFAAPPQGEPLAPAG